MLQAPYLYISIMQIEICSPSHFTVCLKERGQRNPTENREPAGDILRRNFYMHKFYIIWI